MNTAIATRPNLYLPTAVSALAVLVLTSVHHVYGAVVYDTPWRAHILLIAIPAGAVIALALYAGWSRAGSRIGRVAGWFGLLLALAFPIAAIGFYEGLFNHVVKNIAYFGLGEASARTLFPGPIYEMPDSFLFEATGILQFPLAVLAGVYALRLARSLGR